MKPLQLLVVEDSFTVRKLVEICARRRGWRVEFAATGGDGVRKASQGRPDVLLLDFVLPDMVGLDVCGHLAADPATAAIPVLLLTAKDPSVLRRFERFPSVRGHLPKPFTEEQLVERLHLLFGDVDGSTPPAEDVARRSATPRAARLLYEVLREGLARIPAWEAERNEQPPATYFAQRLLTPAVMRSLARRAQARSASTSDGTRSRGAAPAPAFRRAEGFSERLRGLTPTPRQRHVLALLDAPVTAAALAARGRLEVPALVQTLQELQGLGLVRAEGEDASAGLPVVVLLDRDEEGFARPLARLLAGLARPLELVQVQDHQHLVDVVTQRRPAFALVDPAALTEREVRGLRGGLTSTPEVRLVAVVAPQERLRRDALVAAGFESVLVKPVTRAELSSVFDTDTAARRAAG